MPQTLGNSLTTPTLRVSILLTAFLMPMAAASAPVSVLNPGFEDTILADGQFAGFPPNPGPGTTWLGNLGLGASGPFNPPPSLLPGGLAPEGNNVAFVSGLGISQTLPTVLKAGTTYTLRVLVGRRLDDKFPANGYAVRLLAGSTVLASDSSLLPGLGEFLEAVVTFNAPAGHANLGEALQIQLDFGGAPIGGGVLEQVFFDDVRLDAVSTAVPSLTPFAIALLGTLMGLAGYRMLRV